MKNKNNSSLRHRIFNVVFLVGMFMSFSASIINYFLGLGLAAILINFFCGVITVGLYIVFKITGNYDQLAMLIVIMLSFIFFPTMWITNGGTWGSIPYYMIINTAIIALLLAGLKRTIIFSLFTLAIGALIVIEYRKPDLVVGYDSELIRYIDLSCGLFICLVVIVVLIATLIDSYMRELEKSKQYLGILEEKNREIIEAKERAEKLNRLLFEEKQKLHKLSITDYLTGTFNKRFITSFLEGEIEASRSRQKKLSIAMIDIDNFKTVNDTYGHVYGDSVIKKIAEIIISDLRQTDIVGRFGGDEFLIILRDTSKEEGYEIMERIRKKIREIKWEHDFTVTISGGVIEVGSDELAGILNKADQLLYKAKHKSKNLIVKEAGTH